MGECARLGERGCWNTLEVRGEGEERRLKPGRMEDGGRVGRDTSNRSLLLRIGFSKGTRTPYSYSYGILQ